MAYYPMTPTQWDNRKIVMPDKMSDAIVDSLADYRDEVAEKTKKAIDKVTKEANDEIKRHIQFKHRTGKYVRAFAIKTSYEDKYNKRNTWYVKAPYYRLTHLLENGHDVAGGERHKTIVGQSKKFPHILYGEDIAMRRLPELIEIIAEGGDV